MGLGRGAGKGKGRGRGDDVGEGVAAGSAVACICLIIVWTFGLPLLLAGITLITIFDDEGLKTAGIICVAIACILVALGVILTIVTCVCGTKLKTTRTQTHPTTTIVGGTATAVVTGPGVVQQQHMNPYGAAPPPYTLQPAYGYQQQPGQPTQVNPYDQPYNPHTAKPQQMVNPYTQNHSQQGAVNPYERPQTLNPDMPSLAK